MLNKEIKNIIRQAAYFLFIVLLVSTLIRLIVSLKGTEIPFLELFFSTLHVGMLMFSIILGISLFSSERKDNGLEYLLTMPYSRIQLLTLKIIPRILVLAMLFGLYILLLSIFNIQPTTSAYTPLLPHNIFSFLYFSSFIIGLPFAINRVGIIVNTFASGLGLLVFTGFIYLIGSLAYYYKYKGFDIFDPFNYQYNNSMGHIYFFTISFLLLLIISLYYSFKKFNLGTTKPFFKRFSMVFLPAIVIIFIVSTIWGHSQLFTMWKSYYLTANHQLIEGDWEGICIYDQKGSHKMRENEGYSLYSSIEKDGFLYFINWQSGSYKIVKLNPNKPHIPPSELYNFKGNEQTWLLYSSKEYCAFITHTKWSTNRITNSIDYYLVVVHTNTGEQKRIKLPFSGISKHSLQAYLFGANKEEGNRYWLACYDFNKRKEMIRIWEDGRIDQLGTTIMWPSFINGILYSSTNQALILSTLDTEGLTEIKKISVDKNFALIDGKYQYLDQSPSNLVYAATYGNKPYQIKKIFWFDLNSHELSEIKELENTYGKFYYIHPDQWFYVEMEHRNDEDNWSIDKIIKVNRIYGDKTEWIKEIDPFEIKRGESYFNIFNSGIVVKKGNKINVFSLPDMKEIHYKQLD